MTNFSDIVDAVQSSFSGEIEERKLALLAILLDPQNDPAEVAQSSTEMREDLEDFTGDDISEARTVAERLRTFHAREQKRLGAFEMEVTTDAGGLVDGFTVMTMIDSGLWLAVSEDAKYLFADRYGLTGLTAAAKIAENIDDEYQRLLQGMTRVVFTDHPGYQSTPLSKLPDGLYADKTTTWQKTGEEWTPILDPDQDPTDLPATPAAVGLMRVRMLHEPINAVEDPADKSR